MKFFFLINNYLKKNKEIIVCNKNLNLYFSFNSSLELLHAFFYILIIILDFVLKIYSNYCIVLYYFI